MKCCESGKMCRLCDNFLFILGMLNSLGSQCDVMPLTIYHASFAYYPLLVDMHKDEVLNIIYDMFKVTERIKFSFRWTQDIPLLNRSSRLLFTLSTYLCAITSTNPEFFEKHRKLMNMWKINDHCHWIRNKLCTDTYIFIIKIPEVDKF